MAPSKWATLKRLFTEWIDEEEGEPEHRGAEDAKPADGLVETLPASAANDIMALDRDTARSKDADGRLHVERCNISKANVCEYLGGEIPNSGGLGLDATKRYRLLRDPAELERAAATFNNLPILSEHVGVSAEAHRPELVIGSTGTDTVFEYPYLKSTLVFWPQEAIDSIERGEKRELSAGYRYIAVMEPGEFEGQPFDGRMTAIVGNHIASVPAGRAGSDVAVGDAALPEDVDDTSEPRESGKETHMKVTLTRLLAGRAIKRLGLDAKGIKAEDLALAMDEDMPGEDELDPNSALPAGLKKAEDESETEEEAAERKRNRAEDAAMGLACAKDEEPETDEERKERMERREASDKRAKDARRRLGRDESEEERKAREEKDRAEDRRARDAKRAKDAKRGKDEEPEMVDKKAMDAAIHAAADATAKRVREEVRTTERAIREAEQAVRPYVGELALACDSADDVYRQALTILGVPEAQTIHASALPTILRLQAKPGARPAERRGDGLAMDASAVDSFNKRFPDASRITSA